MNTIQRNKRMINWRQFRLRKANREDCKEFITEPCKIIVDGVLGLLYFDISHLDTKPFLDALQKIKIGTNERSSGMTSSSQVFGFMPRRPLGRGDFCNASRLHRDQPKEAEIVSKFIDQLVGLYRENNPALAKLHEELADKILPEWRIHGLFSSGIINLNNPLPYHFDAGNIESCWSIMPVFKKDIEGGHLAIPQLDLCVELRDHTCLMFDGQSLMHGVTPFKKLSAQAYRYTVVYYTMAQLWACLPIKDELARARRKRTETETRHAAGQIHPNIAEQLKKDE
jgi:hypothetical protein